jgi:predicted phage replisome organizer|nr:MAG TPA: replisome organizer protein [Caudoviricetes sp.]
MAKKYYWIRLKTDFFKSLAMKKLRRIAGGDTYTIIYLKLQLLSADTEGVLYFEGVENTFAEEIASLLDEDEDNVKVTLQFLQSVGLLEQKEEDEYLLTEVPFLIGGESESTERVRKHRQRQALLEAQEKEKALQCNDHVTACNTEREKRREEKRESREEKSKVNYQQVADMYNDTCVSFPHLTTLSEARKKAIKARLNKYTLEDFKRLFELAEASDFLKGTNSRNWSATFDWLIKDTNMAKVLDGNYNNKTNSQVQHNSYNNNSVAQELDNFYNMAHNWAESGE